MLGSPLGSGTSLTTLNLRTRRQRAQNHAAGEQEARAAQAEWRGKGAGAGTGAFRLGAPWPAAAPSARCSPLAEPGEQRSECALTCNSQWPVSPMSGKPMEPLGMGSLQLLSRVAAQRSYHSCCDTASSSVTDTRHAARVASADTSSKPSKSMLAAARGIGCAGLGGRGGGQTRRDASGGEEASAGVWHLQPKQRRSKGPREGSGGCEESRGGWEIA